MIKCLQLIYNDKHSSYEELLQKDGAVSIHHKNIKELAFESQKMFKNFLVTLFRVGFFYP